MTSEALAGQVSTRKRTDALIRILILEDNPADAEIMAYELQEAGIAFEHKWVETEADFKKALASYRPDIILSDYDLLKYSGLKALAEAKKHTPHIPFILVTGAVTEERAIEVLTSGARDYVLKTRLSRLAPAVSLALAEAGELKARKKAEDDLREAHRALEQKVAKRTKELENEIAERKKHEQALKERGSKLAAIFESMNDAVVVSDLNGNFIEFNEAFATFHRFESKEQCCKTLAEYRRVIDIFLSDGTPAPPDMWMVSRALHGEKINNAEYIFQRKDGGDKWWGSYSFGPIKDKEGSVIGCVAVGRDITEQKRLLKDRQKAAAIIRRREADINHLLRYSPTGIYEVDFRGTRLTMVNNAVCALSGYSREELLAMNPLALLDEEGRRRFEARIEKALHGEKREDLVPYRIFRKDGRVIFAVLNGKLIYEGGQAVGAFVVGHDVTQQVKMEGELRESNDRCQKILEIGSLGTWRYDVKTDDFECDRMSSIYYGLPEHSTLEEAFGRIHPDDIEEVRQKVFSAVDARSEGYIATEHRLVPPGGPIRWVAVNSRIYFEGTGQHRQPISAFGITQDITQRKQAQQDTERLISELEAANNELEAFSYTVSHDLRAPLRAIDGYSRIIQKRELRLSKDTKRMIGMVRDNAKRMDLLIEDLLALSRAGRVEIVKKRIDMKKMAEDLWQEQISANPGRRLELKIGKLPLAFGDPLLIRQVLANLISNAVKFSRLAQISVIVLGSSSGAREQTYYVKDNGVGFDMRYYDRLFRVFHRLHANDEYEGTGVGLSIANRLIQRHGGRIWAEGKVGGGATFYFSLPKAET